MKSTVEFSPPTCQNSNLFPTSSLFSLANYHYHRKIRLINNDTIKEFKTHLSNENWDSLLSSHDIDTKFNTFLNTFLRIFEANFPTKTEKKKIMNGSLKVSKHLVNINEIFT
jgi:hypothetical protein